MSRQQQIPGTEREVNKRIEDAMQVLDNKRKAKTRASSAHKDAEARAISIMKEEKVSSYTSEDLGLTIILDDVEKAKLEAYHPPEEKKVVRLAKAEA